jgi:uncharacterized protein (TIGR02271 family)
MSGAGVTYGSEKENAMAYEKIVAFYDREGKAREAAHALERSGFVSSDINVLNGESFTDKDVRDGNVWQRIFGRNVSDQESSVYRRTISSGGAALTLRTPDTEVDRAMKILNVHGPMNLHDRSSSTTSSAGTSATSSTATSAASVPTETRGLETGEEVVRLAEEQVEIGKRQIMTGKSRIRRFVTEKPVQQQVTLHEERCEVARREVTDPKLSRDVDWKDRIIEVVETSEQPVVTKTAHIAEEVVIRRRGSDRVETVRDTVRRQQLEVERVSDVSSDVRSDIRSDVRKAA